MARQSGGYRRVVLARRTPSALERAAVHPYLSRGATRWMVYSTLSWCSLPTPPPSSQAPLFSPCVAVGILMPIPAALFLIGLLLDGVYVSARHCCRRARSVPLDAVSSSVSGSVNAPLNPRIELPLVDAPSSRLLPRLGTVVSARWSRHGGGGADRCPRGSGPGAAGAALATAATSTAALATAAPVAAHPPDVV